MKKETTLRDIKESLSYGQLDDALRVWRGSYHNISSGEFLQCNEGTGLMSIDELMQYMYDQRDMYTRAINHLQPHLKKKTVSLVAQNPVTGETRPVTVDL